jgi:hypothetical protein
MIKPETRRKAIVPFSGGESGCSNTSAVLMTNGIVPTQAKTWKTRRRIIGRCDLVILTFLNGGFIPHF